MNAELNALKDALDGQREHVLGILDGLPEQDLRRPVLPTGWSCRGLVRHLTVDMERFWFPGVIAGEPGVAGRWRHLARRKPLGRLARVAPLEFREKVVRDNGRSRQGGKRPLPSIFNL